MVIAKMEISSDGTNQRFVVTNQWVGSDQHAEKRYDEYVQRGTHALNDLTFMYPSGPPFFAVALHQAGPAEFGGHDRFAVVRRPGLLVVIFRNSRKVICSV